MKFNTRQKIWLTIVVLVNAAIWIIPSDVVELIARDRHTLLGRYSRGHFTTGLFVGLISIVSLYVDWATGREYKRRWFQVLATLLFLTPSLIVIDFVVRRPEAAHYIRDTAAYHRPPNEVYKATVHDRPTAERTFPDAPDGYPPIDATLSTDERGYRNKPGIEQCDVLAVGDSFTEGSNVSDEHPWPVRLAAQTGLTVYNLGMSGYDPVDYRAAIEEHGAALSPRGVVLMLFEGNDFRVAKAGAEPETPGLGERLDRYVKQSPIIDMFDRLMISTFGPINSTGHVAGVDVLSWLPLHIPDSAGGHFYAFQPKQLRDLLMPRDAFLQSPHWMNSRTQLAAVKELCAQLNARLVVAYAPLVAHVAMPLAHERLDPDKVRRFVQIQYRGELPEGPAFLDGLLETLDAREQVVRAWCARESIPFVDLTEPLRSAMSEGRPVYFTYDQHWTPEGHEVAAETLTAFLESDHTFPPDAVTRGD